MVDRANWLVGGGEMAKVIKAKDWSTTALGPIESWRQSLRTVVSLAQASLSPISLAWGRGHVQIYNDGYWPICGEKHPVSMGQDFRECWASPWPAIGDPYDNAWAGRSGYLEKSRMFLDRYGFLEETWFTFSFSPITDESGGIGGLFHPVTELTGQMLSERRTQTVRDLAIRSAGARTVDDALRASAEVFADANLDVPFCVFYLVDSGQAQVRRIVHAGIPLEIAGPELVELTAAHTPWSIGDAFRSGRTVELDDGRTRIGAPVGPYPEVPRHVFVIPLRLLGQVTPAAIMVAGISARLALTPSYRLFFELAAAAVSTAINNAHTLEHERRKAEQLAELDRAKTAFFSNVSHEFRTPLTLILGPLEDVLARPDTVSPRVRDQIETAHRNSIRLLKLVNTLLDFSRLEAGRLHASYEAIDLAAETVQLVDVFRAAVEKSGLVLTVDCPPLSEPIYVDREMWEKIVLNLLSNALKHTSTGGITVALRRDAEHVQLRVIDTGIGIPPDQLTQVFERFHRVKGAWSRSHEGTGIGLALVRELAGLLGGTVEIASTVQLGTIVTVTIRAGSAHLPAEQVVAASVPRGPSAATAGFATEAVHWQPTTIAAPAPRAPGGGNRPRVVWADDNADMRDYVTRLLSEHVDVIPVADGAAALEAIRAAPPDLVLSDVMMPKLDGFELLAELRNDPRTRTLPVVLVSARAGVESASEGLDAGADDYLVKPFLARELVARVRTHVAMGRARRDWAQELERSYKELEAFSYSVSHDLRTPLRAIAGFSQILLSDDAAAMTDGDRRHMLTRIQGGAVRMGSLIEDLLALSQVSRTKLQSEPTDLTAIARRIVTDLRARSPDRDVAIEVTEGLAATCDGRLVTIVLENLLANAWKFTGKRDRAEIAVIREDRQVFAIRDNGAGFDMAHSTHLFEPFHRLHSNHDFEGTGIGLAIVRRIVERHGGRVWAEGMVGHGATVRFTLAPTGA
jgi:signal transduction histidine kinase